MFCDGGVYAQLVIDAGRPFFLVQFLDLKDVL